MTKDAALQIAQQGANYSGRRQVVLLDRCGTWVVREISGELLREEIAVYPELQKLKPHQALHGCGFGRW